MEDKIRNISIISSIDGHSNTVSVIMRSLLEIQVNMIKTVAIIADENYFLQPISTAKNKIISKELNVIKTYLDKQVENVSDLIFSLKEVVVSERSEE